MPKHLQEDEQFLSVFRAQQARTSGAALANLKEAAVAEEEYPHVYQATKMGGLKGLSYGGRLALPMGTTREEWPVRQEGLVRETHSSSKLTRASVVSGLIRRTRRVRSASEPSLCI